MLEVRLIHKDNTCAVYGNVVGIQISIVGSIMYTDDREAGILIRWDTIKSIKVVKK